MSEQESQVDDVTEIEDGTEDAVDGTEERTLEEVLAENARLRRESASKRVKNRELDGQLQKFRDWEKSQMTELEREKAEKAELAKELADIRTEKAQSAAGKKAGLDADLYDRVRGDTAEEMLEDAKRLAKKYPAEKSGETSSSSNDSKNEMFAGVRGKPVGGDKEDTPDAAFRSMFQ